MNDRNIDDIFERGAQASPPVDPALLARISASLGASIQPVRPLLPPGQLAAILLAVALGIAVISAAVLGLDGIQKLNGAEMGAIFPALGIFTWLAALVSVAAMTPGGLRWKNPGIMAPVLSNPERLLLLILCAWLVLDAALFHDYALGAFVQEGIPCLRAGVGIAVPTGVASWLLLRTGFAVNKSAAGVAAGTLAGLAGLTMLEFHCPNLHASHIMVWHTAVIPASALSGALAATLLEKFSDHP